MATDKPKVLFVIPYVPSLIRTRSYNLIRQLGLRGFPLTLLTVYSGERDLEDVAHIKQFCEQVYAFSLPRTQSFINCLKAIPTSTPLQAVYSWSPELSSKAAEILNDFDLVHVEHLRGSRFAVHLKQANPGHVPIVWDSVDCISYLFEQAAAQSERFSAKTITRFELPRTRRYEAWLSGQFDQVLITSQKDKDELMRLVSNHSDSAPDEIERIARQIAVLPNGVDEQYFSPGEGPRDAESLVFSGKMSYHANITAAQFLIDEVMPAVWAKKPEIKLVIAGKDPPSSLSKIQETNPNVEITGTVPDLRVFLRKATIAVVPLVYGAGSQFKVLEAMACGTPVIATRRAVGSFELGPGEDVVIAEKPDEIASAIIELVGDKEKQELLSRNGRKLIERNYSWSSVAEKLEHIYGSLPR